MIIVEKHKAFRGTMIITPKNDKLEPFSLQGDWMYRPDTDCWYGCGRSFPAEVCEIVEDKNAED